MTTQPEALRLADELEMWTLGEPAAVELRRLHTENVELREAIKRAVQAVRIEQAQPPAWWPAVENILNEYGLQAIDFVADFKAAQRKPLTDEEIEDLYFDKLNCDFKAFARAIEARSGIKGEA